MRSGVLRPDVLRAGMLQVLPPAPACRDEGLLLREEVLRSGVLRGRKGLRSGVLRSPEGVRSGVLRSERLRIVLLQDLPSPPVGQPPGEAGLLQSEVLRSGVLRSREVLRSGLLRSPEGVRPGLLRSELLRADLRRVLPPAPAGRPEGQVVLLLRKSEVLRSGLLRSPEGVRSGLLRSPEVLRSELLRFDLRRVLPPAPAGRPEVQVVLLLRKSKVLRSGVLRGRQGLRSGLLRSPEVLRSGLLRSELLEVGKPARVEGSASIPIRV